jgi:hypothetical protein
VSTNTPEATSRRFAYDVQRMELLTVEELGITFVEGAAARSFLRTPDDLTLVLEACFSAHARAALLYSSNLTPRFFDVSSREAGEILQKLRGNGVRLAVVREPGGYADSRRFHELLAAERQGLHFDIFDNRQPAVEWLAGVIGGRPVSASDDE